MSCVCVCVRACVLALCLRLRYGMNVCAYSCKHLRAHVFGCGHAAKRGTCGVPRPGAAPVAQPGVPLAPGSRSCSQDYMGVIEGERESVTLYGCYKVLNASESV